MKAILRVHKVWEAVEPPGGTKDKVDTSMNESALALIYQGITDDTLVMLAEKTAVEAWETLKTMHLGDDRVKEARLQALKTQYDGLEMMESESIDDFILRVATVVYNTRVLGEKIEDADISGCRWTVQRTTVGMPLEPQTTKWYMRAAAKP